MIILLIYNKINKVLVGQDNIYISYTPTICLLTIYYAFVFPNLSMGIKFWGTGYKVSFNSVKLLQKVHSFDLEC